jgi:hypothetical protein
MGWSYVSSTPRHCRDMGEQIGAPPGLSSEEAPALEPQRRTLHTDGTQSPILRSVSCQVTTLQVFGLLEVRFCIARWVGWAVGSAVLSPVICCLQTLQGSVRANHVRVEYEAFLTRYKKNALWGECLCASLTWYRWLNSRIFMNSGRGSSRSYRAPLTTETLSYPTDTQIYNL